MALISDGSPFDGKLERVYYDGEKSMKSIVILFISLLSLSLFYSCGDTKDADIPNPIAETEIEANILAKRLMKHGSS